ncbi:7332_t:CDS:1, partial [Funneliformis mosseae]
YETSLIKKHNQKHKERMMKTIEKREMHLSQNCERKRRKLETETESEREQHLEYQRKKSKELQMLKKANYNQIQKRTEF